MKNKYKSDHENHIKSRAYAGRILAAQICILCLILSAGCERNGFSIYTMQSEDDSRSAETLLNPKDPDSTDSGLMDPGIEESASTDSGSEDTGSGSSENADHTDNTEGVMIRVYVCGAVAEEGVYSLPEGSRAEQALLAAGGYAGNAARGVVNLARRIEDGEQLRFPTVEEAEKGIDYGAFSKGTAGSGQGTDRSEDAASRININTSDKEGLMKLPGIGESRAADILAYRQEHGAFERPEDLMKVPGIKEATFRRMKDMVTVR